MAKKTRTLGLNVPVPQSRDDAAQALRRIGELNREVARIDLDLSDQVTELKEEAELKAGPLREQATGLTEGLKAWAEANRDALTAGGKVKFADLGTGKVSWRFRPPAVRFSRTKIEEVLARLKQLGLQRFIRTVEEVNKEAMLADREAARAVQGVTIASEGEDFIVEPYEAETSQTAA